MDCCVPQHFQAARYFPFTTARPAPIHDRRGSSRREEKYHAAPPERNSYSIRGFVVRSAFVIIIPARPARTDACTPGDRLKIRASSPSHASEVPPDSWTETVKHLLPDNPCVEFAGQTGFNPRRVVERRFNGPSKWGPTGVSNAKEGELRNSQPTLTSAFPPRRGGSRRDRSSPGSRPNARRRPPRTRDRGRSDVEPRASSTIGTPRAGRARRGRSPRPLPKARHAPEARRNAIRATAAAGRARRNASPRRLRPRASRR